MYIFKMEADKSLVVTRRATIYQGEKNADTLMFLVPRTYEGVSTEGMDFSLHYILPDGTAGIEALTMGPAPYDDTYGQIRVGVSERFTAEAGEIEFWLTAVDLQQDVALRSGVNVVEVRPAKEVVDDLPQEGGV